MKQTNVEKPSSCVFYLTPSLPHLLLYTFSLSRGSLKAQISIAYIIKYQHTAEHHKESLLQLWSADRREPSSGDFNRPTHARQRIVWLCIPLLLLLVWMYGVCYGIIIKLVFTYTRIKHMIWQEERKKNNNNEWKNATIAQKYKRRVRDSFPSFTNV